MEKTVIGHESDMGLPSIPWMFLEDGASMHLQQRRTITPPKTRSSLTRKGEPGQAEQNATSETTEHAIKMINGEILFNP